VPRAKLRWSWKQVRFFLSVSWSKFGIRRSFHSRAFQFTIIKCFCWLLCFGNHESILSFRKHNIWVGPQTRSYILLQWWRMTTWKISPSCLFKRLNCPAPWHPWQFSQSLWLYKWKIWDLPLPIFEYGLPTSLFGLYGGLTYASMKTRNRHIFLLQFQQIPGARTFWFALWLWGRRKQSGLDDLLTPIFLQYLFV